MIGSKGMTQNTNEGVTNRQQSSLLLQSLWTTLTGESLYFPSIKCTKKCLKVFGPIVYTEWLTVTLIAFLLNCCTIFATFEHPMFHTFWVCKYRKRSIEDGNMYTLDAATSSGILKAKQKLGRTFNSDKLGGIAFTKISKLTMCSA